MTERRDHYSYSVYAERETARRFEQERFGGAIGGYMRRRQEKQLADWLGDVRGKMILDVGAGTGRTAIPLAAAGANVSAIDASEAMLEQARGNAAAAGVDVAFECCDALALPYDDQSFDIVLSFRVLLHVIDWTVALKEICRCSRDTVVIDFPPRWSLAALQVPLRAVAAIFRPKTQRFRLFSLRRIGKELERNEFKIEKVDRLFVLPIMFHKLIHLKTISLAIEKPLAWLGLRRLFGAPVTLRARRVTERQNEEDR
jgi:ubiquinone/menaquinone biosynthesis C-methylase UbiE